MLGWLKRLFGSTPTSPDLYHPGERMIFSYFDGGKVVRADPMVLERKLMAVGPELNIDIKVSRSISKDAPESHKRMLEKLRDIFGVKSLEEGGLTEVETVSLFEHYLWYTDTLKKNSSLTVTSPTGTSAPSGPSSDGSPPTSSSSASGSTGSEISTGGPGSSPTAPGSLTG